jgi:hypothetical protein
MAEWSRETPWRQGCVLTDETVDRFALRDVRVPEATFVVVVSHDCDLAASLDKESEIELIVGRKIDKADGNFTHAKTARTERSILQRWLAARYRRAAFPDAFVKRLDESGASARLTKILKPAGKHIHAIFFDVDDGNEVQRNEPNDTYALTIVILYTSQPNSQESETVALKVKEQIESVLEELFLNNDNSWRDIELLECIVMSDQALTYAQSLLLKQWRLEHLSLREDPKGPMIQE